MKELVSLYAPSKNLSYSPLTQWNPSKADTIGTSYFVGCMEVCAIQGYKVHLHN